MILTPNNEYAVILDACVIAPMPLCDTLLRCAEEPALFRPLWSDEILGEVHRTLQKFGYTSNQADNRLQRMREAFPEAEVSFPLSLLNAVSDIPDPNDKHVVAAAIHERANAIVTTNLKHFPAELIEPYGIHVCHPDEFLIHQYHLNPERIIEVLDTQASGIRLQRHDVLQRLRINLPKFAELIEMQR